MIRIGTAGWSVPKPYAVAFPVSGTHLQRYACRFHAVEINSSFHRPHRPKTYARWAASVGTDFRFAVKLPREITHARGLAGIEDPLEAFLDQIEPLGDRRGPVLVQLPPSLPFDPSVAGDFLDRLRRRFDGEVAVEPRHPSWFTHAADALLSGHRAARVAASPPRVPQAGLPGGWPGLVYVRLHGVPQIYYSAYDGPALDRIADDLRAAEKAGAVCWCIFDNTARGAAADNAMALMERLRG